MIVSEIGAIEDIVEKYKNKCVVVEGDHPTENKKECFLRQKGKLVKNDTIIENSPYEIYLSHEDNETFRYYIEFKAELPAHKEVSLSKSNNNSWDTKINRDNKRSRTVAHIITKSDFSEVYFIERIARLNPIIKKDLQEIAKQYEKELNGIPLRYIAL